MSLTCAPFDSESYCFPYVDFGDGQMLVGRSIVSKQQSTWATSFSLNRRRNIILESNPTQKKKRFSLLFIGQSLKQKLACLAAATAKKGAEKRRIDLRVLTTQCHQWRQDFDYLSMHSNGALATSQPSDYSATLSFRYEILLFFRHFERRNVNEFRCL